MMASRNDTNKNNSMRNNFNPFRPNNGNGKKGNIFNFQNDHSNQSHRLPGNPSNLNDSKKENQNVAWLPPRKGLQDIAEEREDLRNSRISRSLPFNSGVRSNQAKNKDGGEIRRNQPKEDKKEFKNIGPYDFNSLLDSKAVKTFKNAQQKVKATLSLEVQEQGQKATKEDFTLYRDQDVGILTKFQTPLILMDEDNDVESDDSQVDAGVEKANQDLFEAITCIEANKKRKAQNSGRENEQLSRNNSKRSTQPENSHFKNQK